jgi:hypothetical protein
MNIRYRVTLTPDERLEVETLIQKPTSTPRALTRVSRSASPPGLLRLRRR